MKLHGNSNADVGGGGIDSSVQDGNASTLSPTPSSRRPQHQTLLPSSPSNEPPTTPVTTPKRYHRREYEAGEFGGRESAHVPVTACSPPSSGGGPSLYRGGADAYADNRRDLVEGMARAVKAFPMLSSDGGRKGGRQRMMETTTTTSATAPTAQRRTASRTVTRTANFAGNNGASASATASEGGGAFPPQVVTARPRSPRKSTQSHLAAASSGGEANETSSSSGSSDRPLQHTQHPPATAPATAAPATAAPASPPRRGTAQNQQQHQDRGTPPRHPNTTAASLAGDRSGAGGGPGPILLRSPSDEAAPDAPLSPKAGGKAGSSSSLLRPKRPAMRYYRIAYRGIVALLSEPDARSAKSGAYVSYGEIVASAGEEVEVLVPQYTTATTTKAAAEAGEGEISTATAEGGGGGPSPQSATASTTMIMAKVIAVRVDDVLTGGYAIDADRGGGGGGSSSSRTPRRSNLSDVGVVSVVPCGGSSGYGSSSGSVCGSTFSALTSSDYVSLGGPTSPPRNQIQNHHQHDEGQADAIGGRGGGEEPSPPHHGYLFLTRRSLPVAERLPPGSPPICQTGPFLYRVASSTPLPIVAGPCGDAPRTRAVVMPGTVHEVSLRVGGGGTGGSGRDTDARGAENDHQGGRDDDTVMFLRLSHRRGWVADRRPSSGGNHGGSGAHTAAAALVMVEVTGPQHHPDSVDDGNASVSVGTVSSYLSSAAASIGTPCRRRRRPPLRRKRGVADSSTGGGGKLLAKEHDALAGGGTTSPSPQRQQQQLNDRSCNYGYDYDNVDGLAAANADPTAPPATPARGRSPAAAVATSPVSNVSVLSEDEEERARVAATSRAEADDGPERYAVEVAASASTEQQQWGEKRPAMTMAASRSFSPGSRTWRNEEARVEALEPSFFLVRVTAPNGLKILDAPHFQVNNLIHGQAATSNAHKGKADGAIFHTMAGSFANDPSIVRTDSTDSATRTRVLPRGTLFESSKRLEVAGVYTPGSGLIKLSDNSGWAIVPHREELDAQYLSFRGGAAGVREGEASGAYEEVGNAILDHRGGGISMSQTSRSEDELERSTVWLRVVHRGGVLISCSPPPSEPTEADVRPNATGSPASSAAGSTLSATASQLGIPSHETSSDVTSSVASSFLDAMFRTPRKVNGPAGGLQPNDSGISEKSFSQLPARSMLANPVLPCGLCVEVERWEDTAGYPDQTGKSQSFARLCGGQGWVPRSLDGEQFAVIIDAPTIRYGSFWFRVKSKRGIKVRQGPSRKANSIKNDDGVNFRFECGEFLRASEVCTVFSTNEHTESALNGKGIKIQDRAESSECFAKLYRNSHLRSIRDMTKKHGIKDGNLLPHPHDLIKYRPLDSLASPGEWVQVHGGGKLYLEECANPPKIERHRQGWRYNAVNEYGIPVRKGPSYLAETMDKILRAGESVLVNERVTAHGEEGSWLRLKDGHGWVHDIGHNGEAVMIAHSLRHRTEGSNRSKTRIKDNGNLRANDDVPYNTVIARLFHDDEGLVRHQGSNNLR